LSTSFIPHRFYPSKAAKGEPIRRLFDEEPLRITQYGQSGDRISAKCSYAFKSSAVGFRGPAGRQVVPEEFAWVVRTANGILGQDSGLAELWRVGHNTLIVGVAGAVFMQSRTAGFGNSSAAFSRERFYALLSLKIKVLL
jgi:hypothetical protein